ncbi:CapA family protein [Lacinutrix undariae]
MNNSVELVICGDICPTTDTEAFFKAGSPEPLFNKIMPVFEQADFVMGNLEFVLTDTPKAIEKAGPILYGATNYIDIIKKAGFNLLSLANNHIKDCGEEGVKSTIKTCNNAEIANFGAGKNISEAKKPFITTINGIKIGVMAFAEQEFNCASITSYGANFLDPFVDLDAITEIKNKVDYLIVIYHGGVEYYEYPSPLLQKKCRKFVDKGADFVTCQHSHCIGTLENYAEKKILYGQGNTLFGYREGNTSWNEGLLVKLNLIKKEDKLIVDTTLIPIHAVSKGIELLDTVESKQLIDNLQERSLKVLDKDFIQASWEDFCEQKKWLYIPWLFGFNRYFIHLNRILKHKVVKQFYRKKQIATSLNIIRCEAHNEVIQQLLKEK